MIPIWLQITVSIATIIALFAGPSLAEVVKFRINHPKPNPATNQPPNLIQRIGLWSLAHSSSPWVFPPIILAMNFGLLVNEVYWYTRWKIRMTPVFIVLLSFR